MEANKTTFRAIGVNLQKSTVTELDKLAKQMDLNRSAFVRKLIEYILEGNLELSEDIFQSDQPKVVKTSLVIPPEGWTRLTPDEQVTVNVTLSQRNANASQ